MLHAHQAGTNVRSVTEVILPSSDWFIWLKECNTYDQLFQENEGQNE